MIDINEFKSECRNILYDVVGRNFLRNDNLLMYDDVLIGVQNGNHPIYDTITDVVKEHLKPYDLLNDIPNRDVGKNAVLSVISLAFFFNRITVEENSIAISHPSDSWYKATDAFVDFTKMFKECLRVYFNERGVNCVSPNEVKGKYRIIRTEGIKYSTWSERHIAYTCGLGSFGLHGSLITKKGCTHRLMSMVVDQEFDRYDVPDYPYNKNCLSANKVICGECIKKCPAGSITIEKRSIINCLQHESIENKETAKEILGREIEACGLCMSGVPCSMTNPMYDR